MLKDKIEKNSIIQKNKINSNYKLKKARAPQGQPTKPIDQVMRSCNLIKIKMKKIMKPSLFRKTLLTYKTCESFDRKHQI